MRQLQGRTALVTGASRGIGVSIAETLARAGMNLVLVARSREELERVKKSIVDRGGRAVLMPTDLADFDALDRLADDAEGAFGGIDVLVNNAGIEEHGRFVASAPERMEHTLRVNLLAPMRLTHRLLPRMIARGRGHVVNVASLAGLAGSPYGEAYSASKHGLVGFTRALHSSKLADDLPIGASVVCPGFVEDAGMYHAMKKAAGVRASGLFQPIPPDAVAEAVVRAIREEVPEIYVNGRPLRPIIALAYLWPSLMEWYGKRTGMLELFRQVVDQR